MLYVKVHMYIHVLMQTYIHAYSCISTCAQKLKRIIVSYFFTQSGQFSRFSNVLTALTVALTTDSQGWKHNNSKPTMLMWPPIMHYEMIFATLEFVCIGKMQTEGKRLQKPTISHHILWNKWDNAENMDNKLLE